MVAKQQRSLKTAGFTLFIFALAYTVVDPIIFVIADYKDALPSVTGGNIVLEFVVMSFFQARLEWCLVITYFCFSTCILLDFR